MDKSLQTAAEIREQLSDRPHSDSTALHFEEILSDALSLSPDERAMLADHLLSSLDGPNQKEIDAAGLRKQKDGCVRSMKEKWN